MRIMLRVWGWFFCREPGRLRPGPRHVPDLFKEKPTGHIRPYTMPYEDGRGRVIYRGIQVISYDAQGKRISPPTKDELELELKEFETLCTRCGNTVRYWRHTRKH